MGKRTKAHAVKFTDVDWERVKEQAGKNNMTPAGFVNYVMGDWYKTWIDEEWDGLLEWGRPEKEVTPQKQGG